MQFTLQPEPSELETLLMMWALLLVPVGLPLFIWLRRSPRRAQDVLLAVVRAPAGLARRCVDFGGWAFSASAVVGLQVLAMVCMFALLRGLGSSFPEERERPTWLVAPTLAAGILLIAWMVRERRPRAAHDVLHVRDTTRRSR